MQFRLNLFKRISSTFTSKFLHSYVFKMDKAYFRQLNGGEQFQLTFFYMDETLNVKRQFNFSRQFTETIPAFLSRVSANVDKFLNKKKKKKKVDNSVEVNNGINTFLYVNGNKVDDETVVCRDVFVKENNVVLEIANKQLTVVHNSPWIESISLPTSILATFPVYPMKLESFFTDIHKSDYKWYSSADKKDWKEVGAGYIYIPSNNEIDCYVKLSCIPKNESVEGPIVETTSNVKVGASPGYCPFETRQQFTKTFTSQNEFRVVSYNILADLYCDSEYTRNCLYPYCPPYALAIDYRRQLVLKELLGYNADIMCLQEVDKKVYLYDFIPIFNNLDYDLNFAQKGGEVAEGLLCIYNKKKFRLLESNGVVIADVLENNAIFSDIFAKISKNDKLKLRILERKNVLQTVLLESKDNGKCLLIANTHLYFHPDSDHIRLIQGGLAILYVKREYEILKKKFPDKDISLIFCGDFNSVPECGVYKLFTTGLVTEECVDFRSKEIESIDNLRFEQPFKLGSGCGTPKYTNFTSGFRDCLDYIFYDTEKLSVTQVVPMPSEEELMVHTAIPSIVFPSDHISLICDLKWL